MQNLWLQQCQKMQASYCKTLLRIALLELSYGTRWTVIGGRRTNISESIYTGQTMLLTPSSAIKDWNCLCALYMIFRSCYWFKRDPLSHQFHQWRWREPRELSSIPFLRSHCGAQSTVVHPESPWQLVHWFQPSSEDLCPFWRPKEWPHAKVVTQNEA